MDKMNEIKGVLLMVFGAIVGFFAPIQDLLIAIGVLLSTNFLVGYTDDCMNAGGWSWHKARKTMGELFILGGIGAFGFTMGHFLGEEKGTVQALTTIYFAAMWFYSINILNNLKKITKGNETLNRYISFLYFVVSLQIVEKIPFLKAFLTQEDGEDKEMDSKS